MASTNNDVDELSMQYNSTIAGLIDSHARLITRYIIIRSKTPWYNSELSDAKRQLRRDESRWRQTRLLTFFCEKIRESELCVMNEITERKQSPVLSECNDSHEDLAERVRVHFSERILNVRSTMYHHDASLPVLPIDNNHHHHCTLSTFTTTTAAAIVRLVNKCPSKCCALDPLNISAVCLKIVRETCRG